MSNLVRNAQKTIVHSNSLSGLAGKGMLVGGVGGLSLWLLAGLIPWVSLPILCVLLIGLGLFFYE